jgi:predicted ATPase
MAPLARAPLFGRDPELASLGALFDEPSRRGGALVITGDPGTGKSALLVEAGSRAERSGWLVLRVAGVESEAAMPFAGMQQLLRPVMAAADRLPDHQGQVLLDAFGSTRASPEIFLIALATLNLLSDLAARQSLAVIVDDAHWLDVPTREVLSFVARRLETDPIIVLLASREGFGHSLAVPGAHTISLLGLDDKAAADL